MFDTKTSELLDEIVVAYKEVCLDYLVEVGKLGSVHNGETLLWQGRSASGRHLRRLLQKLRKGYLARSREEKYFLLRELYALKPGVHERFYYEGHEGRVLLMLQKEFVSMNSLDAKTTIFFKHILSLENFYNLTPFLLVPGGWSFPSTNGAAQEAMKFLLNLQNWKSLDELAPIGSWMGYASCSINEGPLVVYRPREGLTNSLDRISEFIVPYTVPAFRRHLDDLA